nr:amidase family protein [Levilactobacillus brevis]
MVVTDWIGTPALTWARRIRAGEVSRQELIETALAEIDRQNPQLNAVITTRREKALAEAAAQKDTGQPFLGVPLLLKGLGQQLQGEPSTSGSKLLTTNVASQTSFLCGPYNTLGLLSLVKPIFQSLGSRISQMRSSTGQRVIPGI